MAKKFGAVITRTVRIPLEGKPYSVEIVNDGDSVTIGTVYRDNEHFQCSTELTKDEFREMLIAAGLI